MDGRGWWVGLGGGTGSLAAACGLVVGLRSIVAWEGAGPMRPLVALSGIPREGIGVAWSPAALWPADLQALALERLVALLAALFLAATSVALLNTLVLLLESGASRWREVAVRASLGATPWRLALLLLARVRLLLVAGAGLGLLLGLAGGAALRTAWPGTLEPLEGASALAGLLPVLALLAGVAGAAYSWVGLRTLRRDALAGALAAGERATSPRGTVFLRRLLSAAQGGAAGAVLLGALALGLAVDGSVAGPTPVEGTVVIPLSAPVGAEAGHWSRLLHRVSALPGVEAESLATPGTLLGLGIRDPAMAECGRCFVGGLPLPWRVALADHHAVTPGYFRTVGLAMVVGRDLSADPDAREAVVNRAFARSSFEDGDPVGRSIRIGTGLDRFYTVVGVVDDEAVRAVGGDDRARAAVWLPAHGDEPRHASLLLRADRGAWGSVTGLLRAGGYAPGEPRTLESHRARAAAPLGWVRRTGLVLGFLILLLAIHGTHATALQVSRREARAVAVRRALGASNLHLALHVARGAGGVGTGAALMAAFFGALLVAGLRKAASGVPALGPGAFAATGLLLLGVSLVASLRAFIESRGVEPARALGSSRPTSPEPRRLPSGS